MSLTVLAGSCIRVFDLSLLAALVFLALVL